MDTEIQVAAPDGARVACRVWRPEAPLGALVLLHGVASNATRWSEFAARSALRADWALLRMDLRGQGRSRWHGRIGMDQWCGDLAALLDATGFARAVVGGHCLGANIAIEFARRRPERVQGLVLVEPMPRAALAGTMARLALLRPLLLGAALGVRAANALGLRRGALAPMDLQAMDRETREALARGPEGEALLARYASPLADLRSTATGAYLQALAAVTGPVQPLAGIRAPALALISAQAAFTDPPRVRAALAALPDCEVVELPARHWIPTEQPEAMREAIDGWVAGRFAARGGT